MHQPPISHTTAQKMQNGATLQPPHSFSSNGGAGTNGSIGRRRLMPDTSTHATVLLPGRAQRDSSSTTSGGSMLPPGRPHRDTPPVPPPRPEHSISSRTRDLPIQPAVPALVVPTQQPLSSPAPVVTLTDPRPGMERAQNLYVDAPLKQQLLAQQTIIGPGAKRTSTAAGGGSSSSSVSVSAPSSRAGSVRRSQIVNSKNNNSSSVISSSVLNDLPLPTKKGVSSSKKGAIGSGSGPNAVLSDFPTSLSSSGGADNSSLSANANSDLDPADSIICRTCGLCRCEACRTPRRLPEKWLCGNKCHLSADTLVDTVTCMWVVKAVMYHCAKDRVEESDEKAVGYDNPCSCKPGRLGRWSCLGLASIFLPCLCCYLPLKGCQKGVEVIHEQVTSNACKCERATTPSVITTTQPGSPQISSALFPPSSPGGDSEKSLLG